MIWYLGDGKTRVAGSVLWGCKIVRKIPSGSNYDPEGVCYGNMIWYLGDGKTRVAGSVLRGCNHRIYIGFVMET
jgi:hypothetical protein